MIAEDRDLRWVERRVETDHRRSSVPAVLLRPAHLFDYIGAAEHHHWDFLRGVRDDFKRSKKTTTRVFGEQDEEGDGHVPEPAGGVYARR